ncbi:MAG TPA: hypothetical protein VGF59_27720 [Bryobacteraceae bacterium]|jgi:hypothetical protein
MLDRAESLTLPEALAESLDRIPTVFGRLCLVADLRSTPTRERPCAEADKGLAEAHCGAFMDWLSLDLSQQRRDLLRHLGSGPAPDARHSLMKLAPPEAAAFERDLFLSDLKIVVDSLAARQ